MIWKSLVFGVLLGVAAANAQTGDPKVIMHVRLYELVSKDDLFFRVSSRIIDALSTPKERIRVKDSETGKIVARLYLPFDESDDDYVAVCTATITVDWGKVRYEYTSLGAWRGDEEVRAAYGNPKFYQVLEEMLTDLEEKVGESTLEHADPE